MERTILIKAFGKKDDTGSKQVEGLLSGLVSGIYREPPLDFMQLKALRESSSVHFACLEAKKVDTVGHGWEVKPLDENDERRAAAASRVKVSVKRILDKIFEKESFTACVESAMIDAESYGWGAWEVARDGAGRIAKVYPLPGHELRVCMHPEDYNNPSARTKRIIYVQMALDGTYSFFVPYGSQDLVSWRTGVPIPKGSDESEKANEVIVFRRYSGSDRYYPTPGWIAAVPELAEISSIRKFNSSFFESGGVLSTLIHVKSKTSKEAKDISDRIGESIAMASKEEARAVVVTDGGAESEVDVHQIGALSGDADGDFNERGKELREAVLMVHSVPPYRIGLAEVGSLGGSTAAEMLKTYRYSVIEPWQEIFERELERTLFSPQGIDLQGIGYQFSFVDLNWEQMEHDLTKADVLSKGGAITPNEARELCGLLPKNDPRLDEHYFNGVPLGQNAFGGGLPAGGGVVQEPEPGPLLGQPGDSGPGPDGIVASTDYEPDDRDEESFQKSLDSESDAEVQGTTAGLRQVFEAERDRVAAAVRGSKDARSARVAVDRAISETRLQLAQWLAALYTKTGDKFARLTLERIARVKPSGLKKSVSKASDLVLAESVIRLLGGREAAGRTVGTWRKVVQDWLKNEAGEKITGQISETTRQSVRDVLASAVTDGVGIDEMASRVDALYLDQIIPNRSEVIARTETISAANLGNHAAAKAMVSTTGFKLEKSWVANLDGRERPEHAEAAAQGWIPYDAKFKVKDSGGRTWELNYPGDSSSGAPGEVTIQCRCRPIYRPVR